MKRDLLAEHRQRMEYEGLKGAGVDTAAVAQGQAATGASMVLSDLLARDGDRSGELAKIDD